MQDYTDAKAQNALDLEQYAIDLQAYEDAHALWETNGSLDPEPVAPEPVVALEPIAALEEPAPPQPSQEDIDALASLSDAQSAILAKWNKNPDADPSTVSPEEQALLDELLAGYSTEQLAAFAEAAN